MHSLDINEIKTAILKTFAYRAVFSYPLTFHESYNYLLISSPINENDYKNALAELLDAGLLRKEKNHYCLANTTVVNRSHREKHSKALFNKAADVTEVLKKIPFIKMVAITGSVAAGNADENADIDFFIVTSQKRLWMTRFLVVAYLKFKNIYAGSYGEKGKVCPNIFVDAESLSWEHNKNEYVAHEVLLMKPLFYKNDIYFRFLSSNIWIKEHFGNYPLPQSSYMRTFNSFNPFSIIMDFVENLLMFLQLRYMEKKKTVEVTTKSFIHFKKTDHTKRVLDDYEKKTQKSAIFGG